MHWRDAEAFLLCLADVARERAYSSMRDRDPSWAGEHAHEESTFRSYAASVKEDPDMYDLEWDEDEDGDDTTT